MTELYREFPVITLTSSANADEVIYGEMNNGTMTSATYVSLYATPGGVTVANASSGITTFDDLDTEIAEAGAGYAVWGAAGTMSNGDAFYIRSTGATASWNQLVVRVSTPGVGTWGIRVQRFNSSTDAWETQTISSDTSTALHTSGIQTITFTSTAHDPERLKAGDAKYRWTKFELVSLSGTPTTAPVIDRIRIRHDQTVLVDQTAMYRDGVMPAANESLVWAGDYFMWTFPTRLTGKEVQINSVSTLVAPRTRQYRSTGGVWTNLAANIEPEDLYTVLGAHRVRWVRPTDFDVVSYTLNNAHTGVDQTFVGCIVRINIDSFASPAFSAPAKATMAPRLYDTTSAAETAHGAPMPAATTISYVTGWVGRNNSSTDSTIGVVNATTGLIGSFTIPAGQINSFDDATHRWELSTPVSYVAGDEMIMQYFVGGTLVDVHLHLIGT